MSTAEFYKSTRDSVGDRVHLLRRIKVVWAQPDGWRPPPESRVERVRGRRDAHADTPPSERLAQPGALDPERGGVERDDRTARRTAPGRRVPDAHAVERREPPSQAVRERGCDLRDPRGSDLQIGGVIRGVIRGRFGGDSGRFIRGIFFYSGLIRGYRCNLRDSGVIRG